MSNFSKLSVLLFIVFCSSCGMEKSYFTSSTRAKLERNSIPLEKVQFYVDRDIVLKRELQSGDAKVTSGKIKFENGHYVNIILLKKNTPGVCTRVDANTMYLSFETDESRTITFAVAAQANAIYGVSPNKWIGQYGRVTYGGETYLIQPEGAAAKLMVKKSVEDKSEVNKRVMKGRRVDS